MGRTSRSLRDWVNGKPKFFCPEEDLFSLHGSSLLFFFVCSFRWSGSTKESPTFLPNYSVVIISFVKSSMFFQFSLSLILPMLFFLPSFVSHFLEVFLLTWRRSFNLVPAFLNCENGDFLILMRDICWCFWVYLLICGLSWYSNIVLFGFVRMFNVEILLEWWASAETGYDGLYLLLVWLISIWLVDLQSWECGTKVIRRRALARGRSKQSYL